MTIPTISQGREPFTHELKCHPEPFKAVKDGRKPFEWRKDDRDYRVGDTLWLREWNPANRFSELDLPTKERIGEYTGQHVHRTVTYIIREGFGIPKGYCIMGLEGRKSLGVPWISVLERLPKLTQQLTNEVWQTDDVLVLRQGELLSPSVQWDKTYMRDYGDGKGPRWMCAHVTHWMPLPDPPPPHITPVQP